MPDIAKTSLRTGRVAVAETTLDGTTDGFIYGASRGEVLILRNPTAGVLSPVIDGADATAVSVPGVGNVDVSGGYAVGSIAAGASVAVDLDSIRAYLLGAVTITGGAGLVGSLTTS